MKPTDTADPDYFHKVVDCQWACPAHTPVPDYIRLIAQGQLTEAYMVNRRSNVFPGILGRVCDRPCEPACRRGRVEDEPVAICRLKRVAADHKDEVADRLHASATGLSGGQQQRLVIARAIAVNPEVILMDEPCSALDPIATARIEELIDELRERFCIVIVTHSMAQAARVSQRTAFFHLGRLVETGDTETIFQNPRERRTLDYITGRFG